MTAKSIKYMKWGFFLIFFHIHLSSQNGSLDLLPDFIGMICLYLSLRSRINETEQERRLEPLYLILATDYLLHWFLEFQNGLESLLVTVISIYAMYVYLKEVQKRIVRDQPVEAARLEGVAIGYVLLQMLHYVLGAYEWQWLAVVIMLGFMILLLIMLYTLFHVRSQESLDG